MFGSGWYRICRNVNQLCLQLLSFILVWDRGLLHVHTKAAFWHSWLPSLAGPCFTNCRQLNSIQLRRNVAKARRSSGSAHAPPPGCNYETASSAESRAPKRQTIDLAKFIFSFPSHIFFQTSEATISLFMWLSLLQYVTEHWCILQKLWNNKLGFICFILSSNILPEFLSFFAKNLHFKKKKKKKNLKSELKRGHENKVWASDGKLKINFARPYEGPIHQSIWHRPQISFLWILEALRAKTK